MADTFEDLGLAPELVAGANDMGWDAPTALQRDAVPVLRRGNNGVIHASTGAGVTGAWGLPLLDRLASLEEDHDAAPLALVLAPSAREASDAAATLARLGAPAGVAVRALGAGWPDRKTPILVATPTAALAAVRDSTLKLDAAGILVVIGADRISALGAWDAVRTLAETATSAGQKILVTGAFDETLEQYIEGNVRKAMNIPARPAEEDTQPPGGSVRYAVAGEDQRVDALVSLLADGGTGEVAIVCRNGQRAKRTATALAARGIAVEGAAAPAGTEGGRRILVLSAPEADRRSTKATVLSADPPFDAASLAELHGSGGTVLAAASELPHLRRIAARAGLRLQPVALPHPGAGDAAEAARDALRQALQDADLAAYLSLLQPLLEEHPAAELAAAALYLARTSGGLRPGAAAASASGSPATTASRATQSGAGAPPPSTAFVRLFITVGERDQVSAGDLVGAITGEAEVEGDTVGRIDIRDTHSTVEVASADADRIIRALNGRTLKGRALRVDYDRKDRAGAPAPGGRGGPGTGRGKPGGSKPGPRTGGPRSGSGGSRPGGGPRSGGPRSGKPGSGGSRPGGSRSGGPGGGSSRGGERGGRGGPSRRGPAGGGRDGGR